MQGKGGFVRRVLLPQGLAIFFVSLPIQVAVTSGRPVGWLAWLGVALGLVGLGFESSATCSSGASRLTPPTAAR